MALVGHGGGASSSPGSAGQPGDAARGGCCPRGDGGLLDDHPAAAVALHGAPSQRTAPRLAPVLLDAAPAHRPSAEIFCTLGLEMEKEKVCDS